jgi:hypothetical protein
MSDGVKCGMNVHDHLKTSSVEEIKNYYAERKDSAAVGMAHCTGDFNLGNVLPTFSDSVKYSMWVEASSMTVAPP